ncbi:hypothetical protein S40293_03631 [Stachybotrys chartarum IBT 40293]|nr:hypothetical protein S40293_03631 [Stachybotrys chartarum IBT 40293]
MSSQITCIGIGNMGAALAQALLKAETPVTIWNRTVDRPQVKAVIEAGGVLEPNIELAIQKSDIIVICVLNYETIFHALAPLKSSSSSLANKKIINLTNGTPRQAREAEEWMKARGASQYFDGAVMVTPSLVDSPHSFLVYSGESEDDFSSVATALKPLGQALYVAPDASAASAFDLAALAAMYGMFSGAFIGMSLLKKQFGKTVPGVDKVVLPVLTALVPYVGLIAKSVDEKTWMEDNLGNPLAMQLAGVGNILQACKDEGVHGAGLEFLAAMMERAVGEGAGDGGVAAVGDYYLVD